MEGLWSITYGQTSSSFTGGRRPTQPAGRARARADATSCLLDPRGRASAAVPRTSTCKCCTGQWTAADGVLLTTRPRTRASRAISAAPLHWPIRRRGVPVPAITRAVSSFVASLRPACNDGDRESSGGCQGSGGCGGRRCSAADGG